MQEMKFEIPAGFEVEKVETTDSHVVIALKEKERKLPKSWEEFCEMFPDYSGEYFIVPDNDEKIDQVEVMGEEEKRTSKNAELLPDCATAEAVIALCQLIQLRNCYNGDWVPDWKNYNQDKFTIEFHESKIFCDCVLITSTPLYFKTAELRDEFLRYFRPLIEKIKPLYGINEGGEE